MEYLSRHKLIAVTLAIQIIALPLLLILTREPQETRSRAETPTSISFSPETTITSPKTLQKGEYFSADVVLDPGVNLITQAKIEIFYDSSKIELVKTMPITVNSSVFPKTIQEPVFNPGKIEVTLAVDSTKPVTERVKAVTLYFKALDGADRSYIYFGNSTQLLGVDAGSGNILQATNPEIITISTASAEPKATTFPQFNTTKKK